MSSYYAPAYDPETGTIRTALWIDDYFGRHRYGVQFGNYGKVWPRKEVEIPSDAEFVRKDIHDSTIARLTRERDEARAALGAIRRECEAAPTVADRALDRIDEIAAAAIARAVIGPQ